MSRMAIMFTGLSLLSNNLCIGMSKMVFLVSRIWEVGSYLGAIYEKFDQELSH